MARMKIAALAGVVIGVATLALAQDHPNLERGFYADQAYQLAGIDSVNLYNGNLNLAIPIGPTYHAGGSLAWGLTLYYNSNVWYTDQEWFYPHNPDGSCTLHDPPLVDPVLLTVARPVKADIRAGLGWVLSLGALDGPYGASDSGSWIYTSPDGSEHAFFSTLHDYGETLQHRTASPCSSSYPCNIYYTRDNTYLRLVALVDSCGKVLGGDVEFPDGSIQRFRTGNAACCTSGCATGAQLTQISDAFGHTINVTYPSGSWQISDGFRTTTVHFITEPLGGQVDYVEVAAFGTTTATYQFHYANVSIQRSCKQDDMTGYCRPAPTTLNAPLLMGITLPDGSTYCMNSDCTNFNGTPWYNTPASCPVTPMDLPGTLQQVQLPTGGTIAWTYSAWAQDPAGGACTSGCTPTSTCSPSGWPLDVQESAGVSQRTLCDPVPTPGSPVCGTWSYAHDSPSVRNAAGAPNEARTTVTSPNGDDTAYYFRAQACFGVDGPSSPYGWDYALPYTTNQTDGELSLNTKYLSTQFYHGTGGSRTLLRSAYVRYDSDVNYIYGQTGSIQVPGSAQYWYYTNRRAAGQRMVYNEDANTYADTLYAGYDFLGHFRSATTGGNFGSGNVRSAFVNFNPTFTSPTVNWGGNSSWVLNTFNYSQQTEGSTTARQESCFDGATGALLRSRTLTSGTGEGATDMLGVFTYTSGDLTKEEYYGGDTQSVTTGTLDTQCARTLPTTNKYRIDHTYQYGSLKSSRYYDASGVALSFYSLDLDIDPYTGLPSATRDGAGIKTDLVYDSMGRLTWEKPAAVPGGAFVEHQYIPWSTSDAAHVEDCAKPNGTPQSTPCSASDSLTRASMRFDGLGRPYLAAKKLPDSSWNQQKTYRNGMGWTTAVSEWYLNGTADGSMSKTQYSNFDAFGRPGTITLPDTKAVSLAYAGVRQLAKTVSIATSTGGETTATTTEVYDRQGRLSTLTEPSGSGGTNVITTYTYDVGSRLHTASATSGSTQARTFTYDNRGLMTSEDLPEKDIPAGQSHDVTYSSYDARGHVGQAVDGPNNLTYTYDRAERLGNVQVTGSSALIDLAYASANLGGEYGNGKLRTATRHNRIGVTDNQVVETYTYGGVGGRVSQRATTVEGRSITQGFTWNELGQPATVTYPDDGAIPDPARTVSYTTSYGFLTAVPDYTAVPTGITYSVNMMPSQLSFPNGVSVSLGLDPANIQRVASIATSGASTNWSTGTYGFDGAGNIKSLTRSPSDLDTYVYDKVSRLTSASFKVASATKTQTAGYDAFGFMTSLNTNGSNQTFAPVSGTNRISGVSYDTAGDMTSWSSNPSFNYTWDPLGKMQTLTGTGFNHTFLYTAEGERIADRDSLVKHATTIAIRGLDGTLLRLFVESGTSGTGAASWLEDVVWGNGMLLATVSADPDAGTRFYANDHLGTPRLVTSACATTVAQHTYYPFGTEATATCQDSERTKYTGQERDLQDTCAQTDDLDSMHARVYNPNIARFLSADALRGDPHSPQSFNLFAYVSGNPMNLVDPSGLAPRNQYVPADPTMAGLTGYDPNAPAAIFGLYWPCNMCLPRWGVQDTFTVGDSYWRLGWGSSTISGSSDGSPTQVPTPTPTPCMGIFSGDATWYNLPGRNTAMQQPFDASQTSGAMTADKVPTLPTSVAVTYSTRTLIVLINDRGPFLRDANGQAHHPLQPDPTTVVDLTPTAFRLLVGDPKLGRVPVTVRVPCK